MIEGADVLARVERLVPQVAASADAIEAARRLPAPLVATLHEAGMFRLLLPRARRRRAVARGIHPHHRPAAAGRDDHFETVGRS
jgi:hypothetical protein